MTKTEQQDLEALKIGFEMNEWEDFLLILNEIRDRDKEIIAIYRKSHKELQSTKEREQRLVEVLKNVIERFDGYFGEDTLGQSSIDEAKEVLELKNQ
ncbi:hypothetical protein [Flagellimonas nanhaiensis]|uniref:Uncharacterized protein n=1 Tax=Flagellimonas nanhaiensis TaxID=2292706 RepID=A0A371JKQ6_9FLAO|nr:hypothetical protein [Allomuricauda nanhaiensis]RDY57543.1 hypothetical protein DX873_18720 [Allomuricauda nanhaiensis]